MIDLEKYRIHLHQLRAEASAELKKALDDHKSLTAQYMHGRIDALAGVLMYLFNERLSND
jgi:hypothetical protein